MKKEKNVGSALYRLHCWIFPWLAHIRLVCIRLVWYISHCRSTDVPTMNRTSPHNPTGAS